MQATPPPLSTYPDTAASGRKWTKIIGIIAIVFGAGGILQGVSTPVTLLMVKPQMQSFVEMGADQTKVDDYLARLSQISYWGAAAYGILGLLLLTGGILTLRRRKSCSPLLQLWAAMKVLIGGFLIYKQSTLTGTQMDLMLSSEVLGATNEAAMIGSIASSAVWIGLVFGFIWLCALPVFLLIWFNRRKIKSEISSW